MLLTSASRYKFAEPHFMGLPDLARTFDSGPHSPVFPETRRSWL